MAGGVLSDVYEPTIDNTDVSTLQYIVTDGSTFTDLQTRDMTYTVAVDPSVFTAAPVRRRVFEPSSKRRKRAPGPLPHATG